MNNRFALLPEGFYDLLPPLAHKRSALMQQLLERFTNEGYEPVTPPLVEFEDTLLAGRGAALSGQIFRVMDPLSQRMLAFRPDMTLQVARIAATQLADAPRPLRLCYAGTTLLATGDPLQPGRQKTQAGIECFGLSTPEADAAIIRLAVNVLREVVSGEICVDLTLPGLVEAVLDPIGLGTGQKRGIRHAIAKKDTSRLGELPKTEATLLQRLIEVAGDAKQALKTLETLPLPTSAAPQIAHLRDAVTLLNGISLTIDPVETRGFEYHHLLSFSLFARNLPRELGRGGRYLLENGEPATGCTLYVGTLLEGATT